MCNHNPINNTSARLICSAACVAMCALCNALAEVDAVEWAQRGRRGGVAHPPHYDSQGLIDTFYTRCCSLVIKTQRRQTLWSTYMKYYVITFTQSCGPPCRPPLEHVHRSASSVIYPVISFTLRLYALGVGGQGQSASRKRKNRHRRDEVACARVGAVVLVK